MDATDNSLANALCFKCRTIMKVLITAPSLHHQDNVSGISTMISNIIENAGCEYTHFTAGRKDADKFDLRWLATQLKLPFDFRRAISRDKPHIVHINTAFEPRAIIRDLVLAKSAGSIPIVLHVHGGRFVMQDFPNGALAWAAEQLLRSASRVIVLSVAERDRLLTRTPGLNITVLPNAVPAASLPLADRAWGTKNIVYLGRLDESKGLSDMVEACRMLVEQGFKFRFSCYGAGPGKRKFIASMKEVLGHSFHYGGVVTGKHKVQALAEGDIFLMPSRFEGLPMALLEAMACGCVPVVSNRGSIPAVVNDGHDGFLVEPGDLTQIVGKLKFLLSEGETGWEEYRRNARETVVERFDIGGYVEKLRSIYLELASAK